MKRAVRRSRIHFSLAISADVQASLRDAFAACAYPALKRRAILRAPLRGRISACRQHDSYWPHEGRISVYRRHDGNLKNRRVCTASFIASGIRDPLSNPEFLIDAGELIFPSSGL